jgi:hypothetical protein
MNLSPGSRSFWVCQARRRGFDESWPTCGRHRVTARQFPTGPFFEPFQRASNNARPQPVWMAIDR